MSSSRTAAGQPAKGAEATQEEQLNDIITRFRPLDMNEIQYSKLQLGRMKSTVSSIAEHYLRCQFARLTNTQNAHDSNKKTPGSVPSLQLSASYCEMSEHHTRFSELSWILRYTRTFRAGPLAFAGPKMSMKLYHAKTSTFDP